MSRTQVMKIKLEGELYQDWATRIRCCSKDKWFNSDDMLPGNTGYCASCNRLLMVVADDGIAYYVGNPIYNRKRQ